MPHLIVDYSANLESEIDIATFCEILRATAAEIEAFPTAGIRVRALPAQHYSIADGNPDHGYIDISVRLRAGRPEDIKRDATQRLFDAAQEFLQPHLARRSLALSLEMRDINPDLSPKTGTVRAHMKDA